MPRGSSRGRSGPKQASRPGQGGGSLMGRIGATIAEGLGFGTGSDIAHVATDALLGPRTVQHEMASTQSAAPPAAAAPGGAPTFMGTDACSTQSKAFQECINNFGSDISKCQFYLDMLNECRSAPLLGV